MVEGGFSLVAVVGRDVRGSFDTASVTDAGCSCGTLVADRARCIAAAEGTLGIGGATECDRLGLASCEFCLDRRPPVLVAVGGASCFNEGRMGDVFRDVRGLLPAEGGIEGTRLLDVFLRNAGTDVVAVFADVDCDEPSLLASFWVGRREEGSDVSGWPVIVGGTDSCLFVAMMMTMLLGLRAAVGSDTRLYEPRRVVPIAGDGRTLVLQRRSNVIKGAPLFRRHDRLAGGL